MTQGRYILAIDQGTTSSRTVVFDSHARKVGAAQKEFTQSYPRPGWVEHDPEEIWADVCELCRRAVADAGLTFADIAGIGITNQRETTVIWDRRTGEPVHPAIVWQDRRTADMCRDLARAGYGDKVRERAGLLLDPYFSGTKVRWLLTNVSGLRARAEAGDLAFGTMDSFLLWRLTGGAVHATDATNAARTLMFNIRAQRWDDGLLEMLDVPKALLPEVKDNAAPFGTTDPQLFGEAIPIAGMAGDQHAAVVGQACLSRGMGKSTYGTGCFLLTNVGREPIRSRNGLLTTLAYRINGEATYALEGAIFVAGAAVQWLRDSLGIIRDAAETQRLAQSLSDNDGVYLVPAFTGLGAPHWDPDARAGLLGMSRATGPAHLARAALESVSYQTYDLVRAMQDDVSANDLAAEFTSLRVDGGMVANDWFCQNLADILAIPVERPEEIETTVLGAAFLAGLQVGIFDSAQRIAETWRREALFQPAMPYDQRRRQIAGWRDAVDRVKVRG